MDESTQVGWINVSNSCRRSHSELSNSSVGPVSPTRFEKVNNSVQETEFYGVVASEETITSVANQAHEGSSIPTRETMKESAIEECWNIVSLSNPSKRKTRSELEENPINVTPSQFTMLDEVSTSEGTHTNAASVEDQEEGEIMEATDLSSELEVRIPLSRTTKNSRKTSANIIIQPPQAKYSIT